MNVICWTGWPNQPSIIQHHPTFLIQGKLRPTSPNIISGVTAFFYAPPPAIVLRRQKKVKKNFIYNAPAPHRRLHPSLECRGCKGCCDTHPASSNIGGPSGPTFIPNICGICWTKCYNGSYLGPVADLEEGQLGAVTPPSPS